jgi:cell division protein FtsX
MMNKLRKIAAGFLSSCGGGKPRECLLPFKTFTRHMAAKKQDKICKLFWGSSLALAGTNLSRQPRKSSLVLALCAVMVGFLCLYAGNIQTNRDQLAALPKTIPVTAYISNLNGSRNIGLQIKGALIEQIEVSGLAADMVCTVQMAANFAPETPEERIRPKKIKLVGINNLAAYPSVQMNGDTDLFKGLDTRCIVNLHFMEKNDLHIGDKIKLDMYRCVYDSWMIGTLRYEHLAMRTLKIAGGFESAATEEQTVIPDIIVPFEWVKTVFTEREVDFYADSTSFIVKDPVLLNEFKAKMKELNLLQVNPQVADMVSGDTLVINDETYIRSARSLQDNLRLLILCSPLLIAVTLFIGFVISNIMIQSRRSEFAVMRSLGVKKVSCLTVYLIESVIVAIIGAFIGAFTLMLTGVPVITGLITLAVFLAAYMLGVLTAVQLLGRVSVITMLTKTD